MGAPDSIQHLLTLQDLSDDFLREILELSSSIKKGSRGEDPGIASSLAGKSAGLLFFRPSLRTRTSFEVAMHQLGGHSVNMNAASDFWELEARPGAVMDGRAPEHIKDAAAVLSRYLDVLAVRPALEGQSWTTDRRDESIRAWAEHSPVPMINMESALWHPLQALSDAMTMRECLGDVRGKKLAITWTRSVTPASASVVHSLTLVALRLGLEVSIAHPPGYDLDENVLSTARDVASSHGTRLEVGLERERSVEGAHILYARSWQSLADYGNATLSAHRLAGTRDWTVSEKLLELGESTRVMHAMPVRRNLEITDEVLDGERSLVYDQAENRLHSQKALLLKLLNH
jgi:N-acetylornithine carbamoyltransferase